MNYYTIYKVFDRMIPEHSGMFFTFSFLRIYQHHYLRGARFLLQNQKDARLIALIPRVLPWARSFCPFRACGGKVSLI